MNRRAYLATASFALLGAMSGCQSDSETNPPPEDVRLLELRYRNSDQQSYRLQVILLEEGEPVYWTTTEVSSAEPQDDGTLIASGGSFEGYPTEPSPYVLHARLEDTPQSEWETTDLQDVDGVVGDPEYRCFRVLFRISDGELRLTKGQELPDDDAASC